MSKYEYAVSSIEIARKFNKSFSKATAIGCAHGLIEVDGAKHRFVYSQPPASMISTTAKQLEAARQVEKIKPYVSWQKSDADADVDVQSMVSSINLLHSFASGPSSVPMAAVSHDGQVGLSIQDEGLYLDLTLDGTQVEYLLKTDEGEVYDEEQIIDGRIPPKLLGQIYRSSVKN